MVARPVTIVVMWVGLFLILQAFVPLAMAQRKPTNDFRYMMENQRTHKRKNYMLQSARGREIESIDNGVSYDKELFDPDIPSFMISADINDVILLDNVETSEKSGNVRVKKISNQDIPETYCPCNYTKQYLYPDKNTFPRSIEQRLCMNQKSCPEPYACQEVRYNMTLLKMKDFVSTSYPPNKNIHENLTARWYAVTTEISVGCQCVRDFLTKNGRVL